MRTDTTERRVFVSGPDLHVPPVARLVGELRRRGARVEHSPSEGDPGFADWYDSGLADAVARCDSFVIVPHSWWDSSTWMAIEADAGLARALDEPDFAFHSWHPTGISPDGVALGMRRYLERAVAVPSDVAEAIAVILRDPSPRKS